MPAITKVKVWNNSCCHTCATHDHQCSHFKSGIRLSGMSKHHCSVLFGYQLTLVVQEAPQ